MLPIKKNKSQKSDQKADWKFKVGRRFFKQPTSSEMLGWPYDIDFMIKKIIRDSEGHDLIINGHAQY